MNPNKLERSVEDYCRKIIKAHINARKHAGLHDGKHKKFWVLPTVAVVCCAYKNNSYKGYSKRVNCNSYEKSPDLKDALLRLLPKNGKIGDISNHCIYPVGICAEPHAAYDCICKEGVKIASIHFSTARIIDTGEIMPYCSNCKQTFPTLS